MASNAGVDDPSAEQLNSICVQTLGAELRVSCNTGDAVHCVLLSEYGVCPVAHVASCVAVKLFPQPQFVYLHCGEVSRTIPRMSLSSVTLLCDFRRLTFGTLMSNFVNCVEARRFNLFPSIVVWKSEHSGIRNMLPCGKTNPQRKNNYTPTRKYRKIGQQQEPKVAQLTTNGTAI